MKRLSIIVFPFLFIAIPMFAQDAAFLDRVSSADTLAPADAAYLVMVAAERVEASASPGKALEEAVALGALEGDQAERMTLGAYALLVMKAFGLKGGIFYALFPSPRYAYKELVHRGFLQGNIDPADALSGTTALRVAGAVLEARE